MLKNEPLSLKQCQAFAESDARINIWQGAVRSGKTYSSLLKFIEILRNGPPGNAMIVGVTRDSIQRNILSEICNLIGSKIPGSKSTQMMLLGRQIYFVGANDESAVRRIQGSTLAVAYVDEASEIPEAFWTMLLSRLSVQGAQLIATLNPSSPLHWMKNKYLDREKELNLKTWKFTLDDNPALSQEYVDSLKKEYTGMWYKRYILGEWAVAEGLVYDHFDHHNIYDEPYHNPDYKIVGLDYGATNPTAGVLLECKPNTWPQLCVADTYYNDSSNQIRGKTNAELADEIEQWLLPHNPRIIYVDPSAKSFKIELQRRGLPVKDALNDVLPGIQVVAKFIGDKSLLVKSHCKKLIEELQTYSWDAKCAERGIDRVIKKNDHICDALRYSIFSKFKRGTFESHHQDQDIESIRRRAYGEGSSSVEGMLGGSSSSYF